MKKVLPFAALVAFLVVVIYLVANPQKAPSPVTEDTVPASRVAYDSAKATLPRHVVACFSTKKLICTDGACDEADPITYWLLAGSTRAGTISRCDDKGCDTYDAVAEQSGIFEVIRPKESLSFMFKRQTQSALPGEASPHGFVDIATLFLSSVISTGYCIDNL